MRHAAGLSPIGSPMSRYSPSHDSNGGRHSSTDEPRSPLAPTLIMQGSDAVRLQGVSEAINQQIAKYDSSEFDDDKEVQNQDAEGVWSPDIEQSFQEALAIYPPCGRRKIILSDEGKMYGRNELIARYIKLRTGKTRTRKQVSSHIQVLARRKLREIQAKLKVPNHHGGPHSYLEQAHKEKALQQMQQMSSAQIVSASALHNRAAAGLMHPHYPHSGHPGMHPNHPLSPQHHHGSFGSLSPQHHPAIMPPVSAPYQPHQFWQPQLPPSHPALPPTPEDVKPFIHQLSPFTHLPDSKPPLNLMGVPPAVTGGGPTPPLSPHWVGRCIATNRIRMLDHEVYVEEGDTQADNYNKHMFVHIANNVSFSDPLLEPVDIRQIQDKFPEKSGGLREMYDKGPRDAFFLVKFWADLNSNLLEDPTAFFGVNTTYESSENMAIQCSTKVCSFGKMVVEKVELEFARYEGGRYVYKMNRSPLCEYMINFICKLKKLPEKYMMNSVLENFTILQCITNRDTGETLLCIAYVFEVSTSEHGPQHHIYKLVKD